jgi:uncharacterized membrane protein
MRLLNPLLAVAALCLATAGCAVAGGIFKGGFIIGIIIAVVVIVLLMRLFGGRGRAP